MDSVVDSTFKIDMVKAGERRKVEKHQQLNFEPQIQFSLVQDSS